MWRTFVAVAVLSIAGCAQIPSSPQEVADKKIEPVAGKAVVYVVQNSFGVYSAGLTFDDGTQITTYPGTFYRWVTAPGTHAIRSSEGNLNARITLQVDAGKVYFVQHTVNGIRGSTTDAWLEKTSENAGRRLVNSGRACCS